MPLRLFNAAVNPAHLYQPAKLTVYFQNINGWTKRKKKADIKSCAKTQKADVILLAHTNLTADMSPIFFFPYTVYQYNTERNFSGVAILIKRDIRHKLINKKFDGEILIGSPSTIRRPIF